MYMYMYLKNTTQCVSTTLSPSYPQCGETALHWASHAGQTAVVSVLLDYEADVHAVDEVGVVNLM